MVFTPSISLARISSRRRSRSECGHASLVGAVGACAPVPAAAMAMGRYSPNMVSARRPRLPAGRQRSRRDRQMLGGPRSADRMEKSWRVSVGLGRPGRQRDTTLEAVIHPGLTPCEPRWATSGPGNAAAACDSVSSASWWPRWRCAAVARSPTDVGAGSGVCYCQTGCCSSRRTGGRT